MPRSFWIAIGLIIVAIVTINFTVAPYLNRSTPANSTAQTSSIDTAASSDSAALPVDSQSSTAPTTISLIDGDTPLSLPYGNGSQPLPNSDEHLQVSIIPRAHQSGGLGDWSLPDNVWSPLTTDTALSILSQTGVYLPIDFSQPSVLHVATQNGLTMITAVGINRPFEAPANLETMILLIRDNEAVALSHILPSSASPTAADTIIKDFQDAHPDMQFSDSGYTAFNAMVVSTLQDEILHSQKVQDMATALQSTAATLSIR